MDIGSVEAAAVTGRDGGNVADVAIVLDVSAGLVAFDALVVDRFCADFGGTTLVDCMNLLWSSPSFLLGDRLPSADVPSTAF